MYCLSVPVYHVDTLQNNKSFISNVNDKFSKEKSLETRVSQKDISNNARIDKQKVA